MQSLFDIKETQLGRQTSDAEMSNAVSLDLTDLFTWLVPTRGIAPPSNGSAVG